MYDVNLISLPALATKSVLHTANAVTKHHKVRRTFLFPCKTEMTLGKDRAYCWYFVNAEVILCSQGERMESTRRKHSRGVFTLQPASGSAGLCVHRHCSVEFGHPCFHTVTCVRAPPGGVLGRAGHVSHTGRQAGAVWLCVSQTCLPTRPQAGFCHCSVTSAPGEKINDECLSPGRRRHGPGLCFNSSR